MSHAVWGGDSFPPLLNWTFTAVGLAAINSQNEGQIKGRVTGRIKGNFKSTGRGRPPHMFGGCRGAMRNC